ERACLSTSPDNVAFSPRRLNSCIPIDTQSVSPAPASAIILVTSTRVSEEDPETSFIKIPFPESLFQYSDGRDEPPSSDVFTFAIVCVPSLPPQENSKCT